MQTAHSVPPNGLDGRFCVFESLFIWLAVPLAVPGNGRPQMQVALPGFFSSKRFFVPLLVRTNTFRREPLLFAP